jgi:alkaline phosphatase D
LNTDATSTCLDKWLLIDQRLSMNKFCALNRRHWLTLAVAQMSSLIPRGTWAQVVFETNPFSLGVASGSPTHQSVVLWTRLMPFNAFRNPWDDMTLEVRWELAEDEAFTRLVRTGMSSALPDLAHSVHVEISGLPADRHFFYRFLVKDAVSPVGQTRTLPNPETNVTKLRFAFASCQRYHAGHFGAYRHMLEDNPDLVVFLGDYIYEAGAYPNEVRGPGLYPAKRLHEYRQLYELARSDAALQRMHAACPWLTVWDDHEVFNDYAGGALQGHSAFGAGARREAAYQAWFEHMPISPSVLQQGMLGLTKKGAEVRIYSRVPFGRLAMFHLLDTRQYRDDPVSCGVGGLFDPSSCDAVKNEQRTMLGKAQEEWLTEGLRQQSGVFAQSRQQWNLICQSLKFSSRKLPVLGGRYYNDGWDGYPHSRQKIVDSLLKHQPLGPVIIGGDAHENWVAHVMASTRSDEQKMVAPEFCGTSITTRTYGSHSVQDVKAINPNDVFGDREHHGYNLVTMTPVQMQVDLRVVSSVAVPDPAISTLASFEVINGNPSVHQISQ